MLQLELVKRKCSYEFSGRIGWIMGKMIRIDMEFEHFINISQPRELKIVSNGNR